MARKKSNKLQRELENFNGFQNNQLDILNKISESLSSNLSVSNKVNSSLDSLLESLDSMNKSHRNIEEERIRFYGDLKRREKVIHDKYSKSQLDSIKLQEEKITQAMERLRNSAESMPEAEFDRLRLTVLRTIDEQEELLDGVDKEIKVLDTVITKLIHLGNVVAEVSNRYSQISNDLISVSGASGREVRDTRGDIVHDVISQLNKETGTFFNPEQSYEKIVSIANEANIGSLEAIEEITRPMLLASESMNINNGEIASLLGKWYTRYNFSSSSMESMLDDIKGNTAGNNATAQATIENLNRLESWMNFSAKGDEDKLKSMSEAISRGTSWLESMNVDTSRYTEYLADIASGEAHSNTQLIQVLEQVGLSASQAQSMFENGEIDKLYEALFSGETKILQHAEDLGIKLYSQYSEALGMDLEGMLDSYNAATSKNFVSLDEFRSKDKDAQTMAESVDDKYISLFDRANNWLKSIYEHTASFQEATGIGISDIVTTLTSLVALYKISNIADTISGGRGAPRGAGTLGRVASSVGSRLTSAGSAIGLSGTAATVAGGAGALAGGALVVDGVKGVFDKGSSTAEKALSGVEIAGGAVGTAAMLGLGLSNPIGWAALAIGGAAFLGKKAVQHIKSLDEEAGTVSSNIAAANESLVKENESRMKRVSDLDSQFAKEEDLRSKYNSGFIGEPPVNPYSARPDIPGYAEGSNYINSDRVAMIHEGEAVVPKKYNPAANTTELEMLRNYYQESSTKENSNIAASMQEFTEVLSEIKDFLAYWREDNIKRDMSKERNSKMAYNTQRLSHYQLT